MKWSWTHSARSSATAGGISLTPSRRWEATPRPVAYEVVMASTADELRTKLLQRERERRQ